MTTCGVHSSDRSKAGVLSRGERAGNTAPPGGTEGPPPTSELVRELRDLGEGETAPILVIGACMVLAVPIPGVNILVAFGVAGIGVGMLQHDGVVIALALAFASSLLAAGGAVAVFSGAAALFL